MPSETTAANMLLTRADQAARVGATANGTRTRVSQYSTLTHRLLTMMARMFEKNRSAGISGRQTSPHGLAHFSYEEALFAETGFPGLDACRTEHRMMLRKLNAIRQRFGGQAQSAHVNPSWTVLEFILGVTVGHVLRDIDYYLHMNR